ncbi:MAG: energy-coupling factor transporter transmembrane protein EcfT [Clostridium sp.]|nr:energy-coupling factor transporter transmembrane protein EcfT [Clostridium sp.]MCM1398562.1 energy-coupling factor transporter transmembrane protein EcfT [Clostridium sp.]MCM1459850.1 energy-coupling factor transporter transmembrane protein EcfT [Bacteroides sp.]
MLRDITMGQYYSTKSPVHSIDPRVKIRFVLVYIILSLLDRNSLLFGMLTMLFFVVALLSRVPFAYMLKGTRGIFLFITVCSAINIFTTTGDVLVALGSITITTQGIIKFGFVLWRMILIILMSSMLMYTTTPSELTDGLEKCFHLSGSVAMTITIALRFVSVISSELDRILKAQEAKGVDFKIGGPVTRLKRLKSIIVPLFQNSIDRAGNLGEAMDARCYTGGKGRTKLKPLSYNVRDLVIYLFLICVIGLALFLAVKF